MTCCRHNTTYVLLAAMAMLCIVLAILWFLVPVRRDAVHSLLTDKTRRADALHDLIKRNGIDSLPAALRPEITDNSQRIFCCVATDAIGKELVLASVQYQVTRRGTRAHSFVFDLSGQCVFESPDNLGIGLLADDLLHLNCFWDITGDGNPEKLVTFIRDEVDERVDSKLNEAFQVWTITSSGAKLLLHVHYDSHNGNGWIRPSLLWPKSHDGVQLIGVGTPTVVLGELTEEPLVEFRWCSERQHFEADEPMTPRWEIVFPAKEFRGVPNTRS